MVIYITRHVFQYETCGPTTCFILKYMSGELNYHYPPGITCFILKYISDELHYHYPPGTTCFILKYMSGDIHYHYPPGTTCEAGDPGRVMVM
jgi:ferredoxin-like protein FixX